MIDLRCIILCTNKNLRTEWGFYYAVPLYTPPKTNEYDMKTKYENEISEMDPFRVDIRSFSGV